MARTFERQVGALHVRVPLLNKTYCMHILFPYELTYRGGKNKWDVVLIYNGFYDEGCNYTRDASNK